MQQLPSPCFSRPALRQGTVWTAHTAFLCLGPGQLLHPHYRPACLTRDRPYNSKGHPQQTKSFYRHAKLDRSTANAPEPWAGYLNAHYKNPHWPPREERLAKSAILKSEPLDATCNDEAGNLSLLIFEICKAWQPIKIEEAVKRR